MVKRLVIFLAVSIVPLAFASATPSGAEVPHPNQSLNCSANVGNGQIHCTATDTDGIARIRLTDRATEAVEKVLHFDCTPPPIDKTGFGYADNGDRHRVQILDCKGNTSSFNVPALSGF